MFFGRKDDIFIKYLEYSSIGIEFVSSVIVGGIVGLLIDRYFDTLPTGLIIGLIVGILLGFYNFIRRALSVGRRLDKEESEAKKDNGYDK